MARTPYPRNAVSGLQTYTPQIFATDNSQANIDKVTLAPATSAYGYNVGCILAQYTAGGSKGKFVNYDPAGSNGQNVPVAVLTDCYLTAEMANGTGDTPPGVGGGMIEVCWGNASLIAANLWWTEPNDGDDLTTVFGIASTKIPAVFWGGVTAGTEANKIIRLL